MIIPVSAPEVRAPQTLTLSEALEEARRLAPMIQEEAQATESRSYHSEDLQREFLAAGFYHLLRPRTFGGYEFTLREFLLVMREIARADMATGWCLTLASGHNLQAASLWPKEAQQEIFDGPYFASPMTSAPSGTLARVDGGFIINGKHRYASGVPYSTHFSGHAFHDDRPGVVSTFIAPRESYTILDDWGHTLGLKGSGSHSVLFENAFIPEHYVLEGVNQTALDVSAGTPGLALHGNPIYGASEIGFFGAELVNLAVGGALAALDEYKAMMPLKKTTQPPFPHRTEDVFFQHRFGKATAKLESAQATLDHAAVLFEQFVGRTREGGATITPEEDFLVFIVAAEAGETVWNAVQGTLFHSAGSSAVVNGSRLERIFRDLSQWWSHVNTVMGDPAAAAYTRAHFQIDESPKESV